VIVVDASVAIKWGVPEEGSTQAELLLSRSDLMAPDLLFIEVANALRKKVATAELQATRIGDLLDLVQASVTVVRTGVRPTKSAARLAAQMQHPVYDCIYLALAQARQATFVTHDEQLRRRILRHGLGHLLEPMPGTGS
jgi:predicted nucleic acid-binding protein